MTKASWKTLSDDTLRRLRDQILDGKLSFPINATSLAANNIDAWPQLSTAPEMSQDAWVYCINVVLDSRSGSGQRVDLVWTGPDVVGGITRDTATVVQQLFESATADVFIAGYRFDDGKTFFAALTNRMSGSNFRVQIVLDIPRVKKGMEEKSHASSYAAAFLAKEWPTGTSFPELYYDPRTTTIGSVASMHAKCVVIDGSKALVGSANFTDRGQTRNVELGLLIDDPRTAAAITLQWRSLISQGALKKLDV